jgi:hypothetical protein
MTSVLICPNPECKQALATSTLPGRFRCPNCNWILQIRFTPEGVVLQQASAGDSSAQIAVAPAADTPSPAALSAAPPVTQTPPAGSNLLLYILLGVLILMVVAVIAIVVIVITSNRGPGITTHRAATALVQEESVGDPSRACVVSPKGFLRSS